MQTQQFIDFHFSYSGKRDLGKQKIQTKQYCWFPLSINGKIAFNKIDWMDTIHIFFESQEIIMQVVGLCRVYALNLQKKQT